VKKILTMTIFAALCVAACFAAPFQVGLNPDAFSRAVRATGCVAVSTNASQAVTVKAVYVFPEVGTVARQAVKTEAVQQTEMRIESLTNWCENATANYVVVSGVTNYYSGVTVSTNTYPKWITVPVTNKWTELVVTGAKCVTNDLYSLTCSGGVATSTDAKIIGTGAAILVTGAAVDLAVD